MLVPISDLQERMKVNHKMLAILILKHSNYKSINRLVSYAIFKTIKFNQNYVLSYDYISRVNA